MGREGERPAVRRLPPRPEAANGAVTSAWSTSPADGEQRVRRRHWPWLKPRHAKGPRVDNALPQRGVMMDMVHGVCPVDAALRSWERLTGEPCGSNYDSPVSDLTEAAAMNK